MGGNGGVALKNDNTIITWGIVEKGGRAPYLYHNSIPNEDIRNYSIYNQFTNIKDINMTRNSGCALKNDGTILMWGANQIDTFFGATDKNNFIKKLNKINNFKTLIPSNSMNLALTENGDLYIFNTKFDNLKYIKFQEKYRNKTEISSMVQENTRETPGVRLSIKV